MPLLDRLLGRRPVSTTLAEALTSRIHRRGSLVASAAVLRPEEGKRLAKASKSRVWQKAAFGYARALPEVGFAMRFLANNSTHIRLYVGDRPPGADEVAEFTDEYGWTADAQGNRTADPNALPADLIDAAQEALDRLTGYSPSGGGAAILAPLVRNLETAAEAFLIGRYDPAANNGAGLETWGVHSISEVAFAEGKFPGSPDFLPNGEPFPRGYFRLVTGDGRDAESVNLDPATTTVIRLWTADAEWSAEPDGPMRSLVGVCERLLLIEKGDDAALRSRAAGNGVLLWPEELDALPDDEDDDEEDDFDRDFVTQLTTPLTLDGSAAQVVPMIKRGAYQYLDRIRHLTFGRPLDPLTSEREARLLARLGIGLDVPPEIIAGLGATNHWNGEQISSDLFRHHQEPITIAGVEGITLGYMRARLAAAERWPEELIRRVVVWFDPSGLIAPADMSQAANDGYDRGLIDGAGWRELRGIDESYAAPEEQETGDSTVGSTGMQTDRLQQVAAIAQTLLTAGYVPDAVSAALGLAIEHTGRVPGTLVDEDAEPAADGPAALPAGTTDAEEVQASAAAIIAAAATAETRRLSRRLTQIERTLRERLTAAADAALLRALERAGNRARAAAQRDEETRETVAGQPPENVLASLGRTVVAALGLEEQALLSEAFGRLQTQYAEWTAAAAEEAIDAAARIAGLNRADPQVQQLVAGLRDQFFGAIDASWPVLESGLNDLAAERLFDPSPGDPPVGELPDSLVPPGLIREALARAGGLLADSSGRPPLNGLTSGRLLDEFMRGAGAEVVEYEWAYGISSRPFPPHADLDGVVFAGFDDPVLDSSGTGHSWVGGSFVPGDHKGCHCDYVPIYSDGADTRAQQEALSRAAHAEQYPNGRPIPTRQATVDPAVYRPNRGRPEQRPTPAVEAARLARTSPATPAAEQLVPAPAPLITAEQYADLLPKRGGWTTSTRAKTVATLKATPEGRVLLKVLDSFQSGASTAIPRFRTDMQKVLAGDAEVPGGRADSVHTLLNAIAHSDAGDRPLYRGMIIPGTPEEVLARYAPGSTQDLMLSSFSTDKKLATEFSVKGAGQRVKAGGEKTGVVVEWTSGPRRALAIENLGKSRVFANEREWVAAGRYRVTEAKLAKRGGREVVVVSIEQEGVWGPGGEVLTAAGALPADLNVDEYLNRTFRELDPSGSIARDLTDGPDEPADDEE